MDKDKNNKSSNNEKIETDLKEEIKKARKEGKSEAWIRLNLDI